MNLLRARIYVFLAGAMWSLGGLLIKTISLPGTKIIFYRALFAACICIPWLKLKELAITWHRLAAMVIYAILVTLFVLATKMTSSANAIILQYMSPFFVLIFGYFILKEKIEKKNVICLFIAMSGIVAILLGNRDEKDTLGIVLAIGSGIAFAAYTLLQRYLKDESPFAMVFLCNIAAVVLLAPFIFPDYHIGNTNLFLIIFMGVVQIGIPYVLFIKGLKVLTAQEGSLITLIEPVLNPVWVAIVIGEIPSAATLIGGILILFALLFRFIKI